MKIPSALWVAIILVLPPLLIPMVEKFFPSNAYWWSALLVVILNAIVLVVKMAWPDKVSEVTGQPVGTMGVPMSAPPVEPESVKHGLAAKMFIYGA